MGITQFFLCLLIAMAGLVYYGSLIRPFVGDEKGGGGETFIFVSSITFIFFMLSVHIKQQ
jgi:hypothetical protein